MCESHFGSLNTSFYAFGEKGGREVHVCDDAGKTWVNVRLGAVGLKHVRAVHATQGRGCRTGRTASREPRR